ncbi:MAG: hypothetical protein K8L97_24495 [Anaerolineae bacterium]|nr:hypothetical protein [Anaerolineae bacterium]
MDKRVEEILVMLAQRYAPQVLQTWDRSGDYTDRIPRLARALANYHILVIMGDFPYSLQNANRDVNTLINDWVNMFGEFYGLLARRLFPSYLNVRAHYVDDKWPVLIYIKGDAAPITQMIAGYLVPYIEARQMSPLVSEAEIIGLMDLILEELDGSILRDEYRTVRAEGVNIIRKMLAAQIRQLSLTEFDRSIFTDSQRIIPVRVPAPPLPGKLPEEDLEATRPDIQAIPPERLAYNPTTDTDRLPQTEVIPTQTEAEPQRESLFDSPLPVFYRKEGGDESKKRRPPLPPLPKR